MQFNLYWYCICEVTEVSVGELRVMMTCFAVLTVLLEINKNNTKVWNSCVTWVIIRSVKCSHERWQVRLNFWPYWQCSVVQCFSWVVIVIQQPILSCFSSSGERKYLQLCGDTSLFHLALIVVVNMWVHFLIGIRKPHSSVWTPLVCPLSKP